ncbi:molybdopterin-guanine dinucleotide biosynthesis protein A [Enteractinococcus coprophilus]|uniref:Molybdopterin-guanine dinucleotide biosynthesis protein A n=1 Tax=Enteractinococcus coprophilus TaxID=1027633 RepID=A0A543AMJ9_9MICC|nr:molybdenum cofactor guanylyltransferase [Enteractinococcus coprophilus]TQL73779.1 molybdopterin-guanine dinucleotide biosynthesis protein A [Enteractinococcus coprophilus]
MFVQHTVHAVILTGGRSSRMGGRHKPGILIDGRSVIDRTVSTLWAAVPEAEVVIAGTDDGLSPNLRHKVTVVREDPPFSGPLAGVAAALETIPQTEDVVVLLGGDLPFLSATTMRKLVDSAVAGAEVTSCLDATGHLQYLCAAWPQEVLRAQSARVEDPAGVPLRALFSGLIPELIECDPDELRDIDTPYDLARAVTTTDGRPVPESLLTTVDRFEDEHGQNVAGLSPSQTAEILDFARKVKYAPSAANPAVAAFLAGQLAGGQEGLLVGEALDRVLAVVGGDHQVGDIHESADHLAGGGDVGSLSGTDQ